MNLLGKLKAGVKKTFDIATATEIKYQPNRATRRQNARWQPKEDTKRRMAQRKLDQLVARILARKTARDIRQAKQESRAVKI
jgi:hypothetical protein